MTAKLERPGLVRVLGAAIVVIAACSAEQASRPFAPVGRAPTEVRTRPGGCSLRGPLPDPACTPGAVMTTDLRIICKTSTRGRRHVSPELHGRTFAEYGLSFPQPAGAFEVDHLIPLELGGANAIANLWPEAAQPAPGFHEKDHVEDYLHRQVCSGAMSLADAQRQIATDWMAVWRQIEGLPAEMRGEGEAD